MTQRERLMLVGDEDPFGASDARREVGDTAFGPVVPPEVAAGYPGRWVLLRAGKPPRVIAEADDLDDLLKAPGRDPSDV